MLLFDILCDIYLHAVYFYSDAPNRREFFFRFLHAKGMLRELIRGERFLRSKTTVRPVPARAKRVEGEFPPIIENRRHLSGVRDLDAIDESYDSNPRNYKPQQAGEREVRERRNSRTGISGAPFPHKSVRDLNKREPIRGVIASGEIQRPHYRYLVK